MKVVGCKREKAAGHIPGYIRRAAGDSRRRCSERVLIGNVRRRWQTQRRRKRPLESRRDFFELDGSIGPTGRRCRAEIRRKLDIESQAENAEQRRIRLQCRECPMEVEDLREV